MISYSKNAHCLASRARSMSSTPFVLCVDDGVAWPGPGRSLENLDKGAVPAQPPAAEMASTASLRDVGRAHPASTAPAAVAMRRLGSWCR
jgi:hypothetical protein